MTATATLPVPTVSPEVQAFAAATGVIDYLPAVLEMTRAIFPHAPITTRVEADMDVGDIKQIVIAVDAAHIDASALLDMQKRWTRGLFASCPAPLVHTFCKSLENIS